MRHLIPALTLAGNLVLGNSNDRRIWPGGGFLNRWCEGQWEPGLISQDLRPNNSSSSAHFRSYSAPKAYQANSENCAKLLKTHRGEVAERLNAAVC